MVKMIALDLDNTLLMEDKTIAEETAELLRRAAAQGVAVVVATGRMYPAAKRYADLLDCGGPVVCCNGAEVRNRNGEMLYQRGFSAEELRDMIPVFQRENVYFQLYWGERIVIERWNKFTEAYPDAHIQPVVEVGDWGRLLCAASNPENGNAEDASSANDSADAGLTLQPSPKVLLVTEPELAEGVMQTVAKALQGKADLTRSSKGYIEVLAPGVSKREGLRILAEQLGIRQSEVMACGDNLNDLEMVQWAGVGVAVANAVPELKAQADFVASAERSFGVAEAVRKFVFCEC